MSGKTAICPQCGKPLAEALTTAILLEEIAPRDATDLLRCPHCKASIRFNGLTGKYVKFLGPIEEKTWPRGVPDDVARELAEAHGFIGQLTGLLSQLVEVAETTNCPNCEVDYTEPESTSTCVECSGVRAALSDAHEVLLKESRAAFGRTGPCPDPIIIDKDENNEPF